MDKVRSFLHLPEDAPTGRGVRVCVIDTGVDYGHVDLEHAFDSHASRDCSADPRFGTADLMDYSGHGTQVAGIIAGSGEASGGRYRGIAPNATIVALKAGRTEFEPRGLEAAMLHAIGIDVDIINLSAGLNPLKEPLATKRLPPPWVWSRRSGPLPELMKIAADRGILCLVSGGNNGKLGSGTLNGLCGAEEVLGVAACDCNGRSCTWSSRGPYYVDNALPDVYEDVVREYRRPVDATARVEFIKPDFAAPGNQIMAPLSRFCGLIEEAGTHPDSYSGAYSPVNGTSMAAAVTAGLAACAIESLRNGPNDIGENPGRLLRRVLRTAAQLNGHEDSERFGAGILKWDALQRVIDRFHQDNQYHSQLISA